MQSVTETTLHSNKTCLVAATRQLRLEALEL
jgi:hypothetical protein